MWRRSITVGRLALFLATVAAPLASAATTKATPANVNTVLGGAKPGDVVVLAGEFSALRLAGRAFNPPLVIDATAATVVGLKMSKVAGIAIKGGVFRLPPPVMNARKGKLVYTDAVHLENVAHIQISDATFVGPGDFSKDPPVLGEGAGLKVNVGQDISLIHSHLVGLRVGAAFQTVDGLRVIGNVASGMRSDGFDAGSSRHALFEANECSGTKILKDEHPDCIQLWSRPAFPPTADVTIRKNKIVGATQGIGMFNHIRNGVDDGGFDRILIEDNEIEVTFGNAIGLSAARDSIVRNNHIRTGADSKYWASLHLDPAVSHCGNVVAAGAGKRGVTEKGC